MWRNDAALLALSLHPEEVVKRATVLRCQRLPHVVPPPVKHVVVVVIESAVGETDCEKAVSILVGLALVAAAAAAAETETYPANKKKLPVELPLLHL